MLLAIIFISHGGICLHVSFRVDVVVGVVVMAGEGLECVHLSFRDIEVNKFRMKFALRPMVL